MSVPVKDYPRKLKRMVKANIVVDKSQGWDWALVKKNTVDGCFSWRESNEGLVFWGKVFDAKSIEELKAIEKLLP